jgi:poly(A) polymerase
MDRRPSPTEKPADLDNGQPSLTVLDLQIKRHEKVEQSQSLLSKGVEKVTHLIWNGEEQSLAALKALKADIEESRRNNNTERLKQLESKAKELVRDDVNSLVKAREVNQYGTGFVKTAAMFGGGRIGFGATTLAYGLDEVHSRDRGWVQGLDLGLGCLKGAGMKLIMSKLGELEVNPAVKGAALGLANTGAETLLSRSTWKNNLTGEYSAGTGISKILSTTLDPNARILDAAVFAGAYSVFGLANKASGGLIENSKSLSSILMGTSFGLSTGATREYSRQRQEGENLDLSKILRASVLQGGLDSIASLSGTVHLPSRSAAVARREAGEASGQRQISYHREVDQSAERAGTSASQSGDNAAAGRKEQFEGYTRRRQSYQVAAAEGPFEDYGDFLWRGKGYVDPVMRTHSIAGMPETKLVYADSEARFFSRLKASRYVREHAQELQERFTGPKREKLDQIICDSGNLERHVLAGRLGPEGALQLVRELPDPRMIKELTVLNQRHWEEPWRRQQGDADMRILAEVTPEGSVTLYSPSAAESSRDTLFHEWSHLLKFRFPHEGRLFDSVGELEPVKTSSPSDLSRGDEPWAVLVGEDLLNRSLLVGVAAAQENPIRAAVAGQVLARVLDGVPEAQRGIRHAQYKVLTDYINENVRPEAQRALVAHIEEGSPAAQARALHLLANVGDASHLALIEGVSRQAGAPEVRQAAAEAKAALEGKIAGREVVSSPEQSGARTNSERSQFRITDESGVEGQPEAQGKDGRAEAVLRDSPELAHRRKDAATKIVERLQQEGHIAVLVGGCVRDELLGRVPHDYDIATSAAPEQVEAIFASAERTGKGTGPVRVFLNNVPTEVSTLRLEGPERAQLLTRADEESLRLDAQRRDLTTSALMKDPVTGRIYDFFGGIEDLQRGVIRSVGDPQVRVVEDSYRMLRAVRMASELNFVLDPALKDAITRHAARVNGIDGGASRNRDAALPLSDQPVPADKVREELLKIAGSKQPLVGLDLLMETGLMKAILPEVVETNTERGEQDPRWHPEGNTWIHTRGVVDILARNGAPAEVVLAGLLHDIGKPDTQVRHPDGRITNTNHAEVGARLARAIARRLDFSPSRVSRLTNIVRLHMTMHKGDEMRHGRLTRLLENRYIDDLITLQDADSQVGSPEGGRKSLRPFYLQKLEEFRAKARETERLGADPLVTGQTLIDLGHTPGPKFKEMLNEAREAQAEGAFGTADEAREWARIKYPLGAPASSRR